MHSTEHLRMCNNIDELSAAGNWDDVFLCLHLDANSTIELGALKIPPPDEVEWLDQHKATLNSLEVILALILLCDQIFYLALLWYLVLFTLKFLRHHGIKKLKMMRYFKRGENSRHPVNGDGKENGDSNA